MTIQEMKKNCRTCCHLVFNEIGRIDVAMCDVYDDIKDIHVDEIKCPRYGLADMEVD